MVWACQRVKKNFQRGGQKIFFQLSDRSIPQNMVLTWRNHRLPSPTRINLEEPQVTQPSQDTLTACGLEELFSSCGFLSVFGSGEKKVLVLHTYVLRVEIQLWCCVSFLVLVGNSFWCYVRTQCTIQLCGCVSFLVVAGNRSKNKNMFLQKKLFGLLYYDLLANVCIS